MNPEKERTAKGPAPQSPFRICFIIFLLLAGDYGFRLFSLVQQRTQLDQARILQAENTNVLVQARQLEARLQSLSLELLQMAKTNSAASKIVQDFNIQWTPTPPTASVAQTSTPTPAAKKK